MSRGTVRSQPNTGCKSCGYDVGSLNHGSKDFRRLLCYRSSRTVESATRCFLFLLRQLIAFYRIHQLAFHRTSLLRDPNDPETTIKCHAILALPLPVLKLKRHADVAWKPRLLTISRPLLESHEITDGNKHNFCDKHRRTEASSLPHLSCGPATLNSGLKVYFEDRPIKPTITTHAFLVTRASFDKPKPPIKVFFHANRNSEFHHYNYQFSCRHSRLSII